MSSSNLSIIAGHFCKGHSDESDLNLRDNEHPHPPVSCEQQGAVPGNAHPVPSTS